MADDCTCGAVYVGAQIHPTERVLDPGCPQHGAVKLLAERKIHVAPSGSSGQVTIMLGSIGRVLPRSEVRLLVAALLACADPGVGDRMADAERELREEIARPQPARKRKLRWILHMIEGVRRG